VFPTYLPKYVQPTYLPIITYLGPTYVLSTKFIYLSTYLFIYLFTYYLPNYLSIYLPTYLLFIYLSIYQSTYLPIMYLPIHLCIVIDVNAMELIHLNVHPCS
jgi:hypothetical protein